MSGDADYLYALEMQKRFNAEVGEGDSDIEEIDFKPPPAPTKKKSVGAIVKRSNPHSNLDEDFLNRTRNLVHPQWETLDPTPDIFSLFGNFDTKFFQGRLKCVTLEWSKRMYSCAGICYSRRNRLGMDVTIRLSEPLLKLRPRKDLVETMLHEMIHAYCFVLNIREGNGGHGPNFKKIMGSINTVAGTNITVYHTFHDEVELYKQHEWRCNGSCQHRAPFFGYVKRTCNRAPGPNDQWWAAHQESCGGTFMKIKGPELKKKTKKEKPAKEKPAAQSTDLRKFFNSTATESKPPVNSTNKSGSSSTNINGFGNLNGGFKGPIKSNGGGTMLLNPKTNRPSSINSAVPPKKSPALSSIAAAFPPTSYPGLSTDPFNTGTTPVRRTPTAAIVPPGGNLRNVMSFRDLNSSGSDSGGGGNSGRAVAGFKTEANNSMSGRGYALDSGGYKWPSQSPTAKANSDQIDRNHLRDVWTKRFGGGNGDSSISNRSSAGNFKSEPTGDSKRRRLSTESAASTGTNYIADELKSRNDQWVVLDDDVMLQDQPVQIIALSSDSDSDSDVEKAPPRIKPKPLTSGERQNAIKQEILDESINLNDEDIILIDDEYDDDEDLLNLSAAAEIADTSIIDEFFGEDTLLKEFKRENDVIPTGSRHVPNPQNDIITCPICQGKMKRNLFAEHLDGCTGIAIRIVAPKHALKKLAATARELKPSRRSAVHSRNSAKEILRNAGYSEQDLANIAASSAEEDELNISSPTENGNSTTFFDLNSSSEDDNNRRYRQRNILKTTRQCPVCAQEIEESEMNEHLDECLSK